MSAPSIIDSRAANPAEAGFAQLERHANRILLAGVLIAANLFAVEIVRAARPDTLWHSSFSLGLGALLVLLIWRLSRRQMGFAVRAARRQSALTRMLMHSAERFAHEPAGVHGSMEALCATARQAGCDVLLWDAADRALWTPVTGERIGLTAALTRHLLDSLGSRRMSFVPDVQAGSPLPMHLAARDDTRAIVLVPMWSGGDLLGVVLRRYRSARAMYRAGDGPLVSALAALGAVAIGKALVVDREAQRLRDNELLVRSVTLASEHAQRDHLIEYAHQAAETVGANICAVYARAGGQLQLLGSCGIARATALAARGIPTRSTVAQLAEQTQDAFVCPLDTLDDVRPALQQLGFASDVVVQPVHDQIGLAGIIVMDDATGALGDREQTLLFTLARHVSMTLERSRMVRAMRKRSRHLACTPKLARSLTGQREPSAVARIAARELHEGFGFGRISIALADADGTLGVVASAGMLARTPGPATCTDVMRAAFDSVRPYVTCAGEGDSARLVDDNAPAGCRSQIVVPIVGHDHACCGVIAVYERDPDALGEDDLHMLETIADQLAGTLEQAGLFETLERTYFKTVEALSAALEAKDAYTLDHARSITDASASVGRRMGMSEDEIRDLKLGALLHDIGKIGVPGEILNKPGPLTDAEFEVMKEHTVIGEQIIAPIEFLEGVRPLVLHEHERWDGTGYPHRLRGEQIPLGARIIFVCDAWHAMTSNRPYRKALPLDVARARLVEGAGSQFDPRVVDAFLDVLDTEPALLHC